MILLQEHHTCVTDHLPDMVLQGTTEDGLLHREDLTLLKTDREVKDIILLKTDPEVKDITLLKTDLG